MTAFVGRVLIIVGSIPAAVSTGYSSGRFLLYSCPSLCDFPEQERGNEKNKSRDFSRLLSIFYVFGLVAILQR